MTEPLLPLIGWSFLNFWEPREHAPTGQYIALNLFLLSSFTIVQISFHFSLDRLTQKVYSKQYAITYTIHISIYSYWFTQHMYTEYIADILQTSLNVAPISPETLKFPQGRIPHRLRTTGIVNNGNPIQ